MRIAEVRVKPVRRPVGVGVMTAVDAGVAAGAQWREHLLVEIETTDGVIGYGEAAPDPRWPRGLNREAIAAIITTEYCPLLLGRDPRALGTLIPALERAAAETPFALAPVDMALWDVWGRAEGRAVCDLLGGAVRERVALHHTIGIKPADAVADEVRRAGAAGYLDFKLKVGGADFDGEMAAMAAIRATAGPRARIRVDANQGWTPGEAVRCVRALNRHGLHLVEQPVAHGDIAGLRHVRRRGGVPVMADESVFSPADVFRLAAAEAVDVINIKLMKTGGLWRARQVAAVAEAAGLEGFMGSMFEMEVGAAAALHFAMSQAIICHPTGILHRLHAEPLADPAWDIADAHAKLHEGIKGLGVTPR